MTHLPTQLDDALSEIDRGDNPPPTLHHYLVICVVNEDTGEDNYEEEREYEIIHDEKCPTESWYDDLSRQHYEHHSCAVQYEVEHVGMDSLEDENGLTYDELEPGIYEIEFWSEHHNSYYGGEEYSSGLSIVGGPYPCTDHDPVRDSQDNFFCRWCHIDLGGV